MVYAAVLQSPYAGGAPLEVDDARARKVPGVTDIVKLPEGVGVIATTVEAAFAAKRLLRVTWGGATGAHLDSEQALGDLAAIGRDKSRAGVPFAKIGDAKAALASAKRVFRGEYRTRYVYHAQMEPMNATAAVSADGKSVEIWAGTQAATSLLKGVAKMLGTERSNITLHQQFLGGGFGRRGNHEAVFDAVRLAKAAGKPVKYIWTREDDVTFGKFRPMTAHHIEAGFDADNKLVAWHHRVVAEFGRGLFVGRSAPAAGSYRHERLAGPAIPGRQQARRTCHRGSRRPAVAVARRRQRPQRVCDRELRRRDSRRISARTRSPTGSN